MQKAFFKATCPVEIGDIIIKKDGERQAVIFHNGQKGGLLIQHPAKFRRITDIAAVHFLKTGQVHFQYELDNSGHYEVLEFVMPNVLCW